MDELLAKSAPRTVSRDGLWKILARLGGPPQFLTIFCQLHEGQQGQVKHNGSRRQAGMRSSWPPYCTLSSSPSCSVRQKRTCQTSSTSVSEQAAVSSTFGVSSHGLTISLKKSEEFHQPPPRVAYSPPHTSIDGTNLNAMEHFTYLGNVITKDATVSKDLDNCLSKVSSSF